jgi:hypothetical protein
MLNFKIASSQKTLLAMTAWFVAVFFLYLSPALSAEKNWSGKLGDGISWEDPLNWLPEGVPTAADTVYIDVPGSNVVASKTYAARTLSVGATYESSFTSGDFIYGGVGYNSPDSGINLGKYGTWILKGPGVVTMKGPLDFSLGTVISEPAFMFVLE